MMAMQCSRTTRDTEILHASKKQRLTTDSAWRGAFRGPGLRSLTRAETSVGRAPVHEDIGAVGSVLETSGVDPVGHL